MIREIDEKLISPASLMNSSDMAKLGCGNCTGCSDCCRDRAELITLDAYDIRLLKNHLNYSFEGLLGQGLITLSVVDGVVLPCLSVRPAGAVKPTVKEKQTGATEPAGGEKQTSATEPAGGEKQTSATEPAGGEKQTSATEPAGVITAECQDNVQEECIFLGSDGRCEIHAFRPGICRMFPLARIYHEDGSFSYFLQEGECSQANGVKIRISKWLGYPNIREYELAVRSYHDALSSLRIRLKNNLPHEEQVALQRWFLDTWFVQDFSETN